MKKYALIIGNNQYDDSLLESLKTPEADVQALVSVLRDKQIGGFDEVVPWVNHTDSETRREIGKFVKGKKPDDLILIYFSGHGVLDENGRLCLAVKDTDKELLETTAIPSLLIRDMLNKCRSKRKILILDCCYSGAFERGIKAGYSKAVTEETFQGYGHVVLTATDETQYAWEGDRVIGDSELSLFTHYLLDGLETGGADLNKDGEVTIQECYYYAYEEIKKSTYKQAPRMFGGVEGEFVIAKNPFAGTSLPKELLTLIIHSNPKARILAAEQLGELLDPSDSDLSNVAQRSLEALTRDYDPKVSNKAQKQLLKFEFEKAKKKREATEKAAKEKAEREAAEKAAREKAEKEAAEKTRLENEERARQKAAKEKAEREAAEKATREKAEKEAAEKTRLENEERARQKAAKEKAEREAAEKAAREKVGKSRLEVVEKAKQKGANFLFELVSIAIDSIDHKTSISRLLFQFISIVMIIGVVISFALPFPSPAVTVTPSKILTPSKTPTLGPSKTPTKRPTQTKKPYAPLPTVELILPTYARATVAVPTLDFSARFGAYDYMYNGRIIIQVRCYGNCPQEPVISVYESSVDLDYSSSEWVFVRSLKTYGSFYAKNGYSYKIVLENALTSFDTTTLKVQW